jgi:hypothetical protein
MNSDENTVTASAYSGARKMKPGQSITFDFALLITPVKSSDANNRFSDRYYHYGGADVEPTEEVQKAGGNILNIHHANRYNPFINYPFIAQKELRALVDKWHEKDWKVKIYYTVRELSNHLTEIGRCEAWAPKYLPAVEAVFYHWLQETC